MSEQQRPLSAEDERLIRIISAAIKAGNAPNVLQQLEIDKLVQQEKRKALMQRTMAQVEEEAARRKKDGCSHSRWPMSAGKIAGHSCPKGQGEWTTGGQLVGSEHGKELAFLVCQRCGSNWKWKPNSGEYESILTNGLQGWAPPATERVIAD